MGICASGIYSVLSDKDAIDQVKGTHEPAIEKPVEELLKSPIEDGPPRKLYRDKIDGHKNRVETASVYKQPFEEKISNSIDSLKNRKSLKTFWIETIDENGYSEIVDVEQSRKIDNFLRLRDKNERLEDIAELCEDQSWIFKDIIKLAKHADEAITAYGFTENNANEHTYIPVCRSIVLTYPDEFYSAISWVDDFPEIALAYDMYHSVRDGWQFNALVTDDCNIDLKMLYANMFLITSKIRYYEVENSRRLQSPEDKEFGEILAKQAELVEELFEEFKKRYKLHCGEQ